MSALKLAFALAVFATGIVGGAVPLWRREAVGRTRFLGFGNAFAAGVFLGAGMIHMLPDAGDAWRALGWDYPVGFLLAALAIVAMLLFEHVLLPESAHEMVHHGPSGEPFARAAQWHGHGPGLAAYAVLTALSVHAFLAGLALGAQSAVAGAVVLFIAIAAHKSAEGFALGVALARTGGAAPRAWRLLVLFALATPAGILVGALLGGLAGPAQHAFEATFLSLAAGTFVYVALLDILRDEFLGRGRLWAKWLWVAVGTASMGALAALV